MSATYSGSSVTGSLSERYAYDRNGNMALLNRNSQNIAMNLIGNRLMAISGKSFTYDAKGRQVSSAYGTAVSTQYNILDLPQRHTIGNRSIIVDYAYSADGRKLQERVCSGAGDVVRDYAGEFIFENGELKKILFDGGYVDFSSGSPVYMFFLKDHLGSVRAVVTETGEVVQTNEYYPYGDLFSNSESENSDNRLRFSGKELSAETGMYDFSARYLQPKLGRFTTIDPLAEKYPHLSPYAYCNCNPVNFVDPDGKIFKKIIRRNTITIKASYYTTHEDKQSAYQAICFWNKRQDVYTSPSGKQYSVNYDLQVIPIDNTSKFEKSSNTYALVDKFSLSRTTGTTEEKRKIQVLRSYSETRPNSNELSTTGAHEVGHTLGMLDGGEGIMSYSQDELRTDNVSQNNLQQMLDSPVGQEDWLSMFFKIK